MFLAPEPISTGFEKKLQNPEDTSNDQRKRAEDLLFVHFEQTEKVLSELKATQLVVLQDLYSVKLKL